MPDRAHRTHHNLTYAQNVDNKGFKEFNQIKSNVSYLIVGKKRSKKVFSFHLRAWQGTQTHHNLTYAQNVHNKGSKKFNQIKLNVSFLFVSKKGPKKVFSFYLSARQGTQTHQNLIYARDVDINFVFCSKKSFNIIYI